MTDVDGMTMFCMYCNWEFGIVVFSSKIKSEKKCLTCNDSTGTCPECGITGEDMEVKFCCNPCQIKHNVTISGESL